MMYFVETSGFTEWVAEQPPDWDIEYALLQNRLSKEPESGKVMRGCGGLRKIRMPDSKRGKGKRSGVRIIYLQIPEVDCICMIDAYDKNEKADLRSEDRQVLARLAHFIKERLLRAARLSKSEREFE